VPIIKKLLVFILALLGISCGIKAQYINQAEYNYFIRKSVSNANYHAPLQKIHEYIIQGKYDLAKELISKHQKDKTVSLIIKTYYASVEYIKGNYRVSEKICDSVLAELSNAQDNPNYSRALNYKAKAVSALGDNKLANECVNKALQNALKNKDDYSISSCYYYKGVFSSESGKYEESIQHLLKSKQISEKLKDKINISAVLSFLGLSYSHIGKYAEAIDVLNESIIIRTENGDKRGLANSYLNMNKVYTELNDNPKRLEYENKSLKICEEIGDQQCISGRLTNIGDIYFLEGNLKKAYEYQIKAFRIAKKLGIKYRIAEIHFHIAQIHNAEKKFQLALSHIDTCINLRELNQDNEGLGSANILKASILSNLGSMAMAQEIAQQAYTIGKEYNLIHVKRDAHEILGKIFEEKGDFKQAFYHLKEFQILKDSLFNIEKSKVFVRKELEKKYQINEINNNKIRALRELEIRNQRERFNQLIWVGIVLIIVLSIFIYLFYSKYQAQKKINTIVTENQELNSQIATLEKQSIFSQTISTIAHELNTPLGVVYAGSHEQKELGNSLIEKWKRTFTAAENKIINEGIRILHLPSSKTSALDKRKQATPIFLRLKKNKWIPEESLEEYSIMLASWEKQSEEMEVLFELLDSSEKAPEILVFLNTIYKYVKINQAIDHSIVTSKSVLQELNEMAEKQLDKSNSSEIHLLSTIQRVIDLKKFHDFGDLHFELKIKDDAQILLDEKELIQIATQILQNMVEALEENQNKKIIIIQHIQTVEFNVLEFSNNGQPIAKENIDKIFDRFFTTKNKNNHRGLGLSIVKNTIESYGGSISVSSNNEKTLFSICLKR
jgi:signal transduction histidine kinase